VKDVNDIVWSARYAAGWHLLQANRRGDERALRIFAAKRMQCYPTSANDNEETEFVR
jgi:hypothetical protein